MFVSIKTKIVNKKFIQTKIKKKAGYCSTLIESVIELALSAKEKETLTYCIWFFGNQQFESEYILPHIDQILKLLIDHALVHNPFSSICVVYETLNVGSSFFFKASDIPKLSSQSIPKTTSTNTIRQFTQ